MNYSEVYALKQRRIEEKLGGFFLGQNDYEDLYSAMRYSLLAGGKRLRPILVMSFCEAVGGDVDDAMNAAAAIEMIHTYSLIHDDLPCMDDDDYRRGRLTCHRVYGENMAVLAGDALLTAAFRVLAETENVAAERVLRCLALLAAAAGEDGMVAGQVMDLHGEGQHLDEAALRRMYAGKTGALIYAACTMGAILGGGSEAQIQAAGEYARALGIAFQIRDDMLDVIGTQEELGKPIGSDEGNDKSTFVSLLGLEQCGTLVSSETEKAIAALACGLFTDTDFLRELALGLVDRKK